MKRKSNILLSMMILLLGVMVIFTTSCAGSLKTVEEACIKADEIVEEWSKDAEKTCKYDAQFVEKDGAEIYLVNVQSLTVEDDTDSYKSFIAGDVSSFVYEELSPIFKDFPDVIIGVAVLDENNQAYYLTRNGEVVFNSYA